MNEHDMNSTCTPLIGEWTPDRPTLDQIKARVREVVGDTADQQQVINVLGHYYSYFRTPDGDDRHPKGRS